MDLKKTSIKIVKKIKNTNKKKTVLKKKKLLSMLKKKGIDIINSSS